MYSVVVDVYIYIYVYDCSIQDLIVHLNMYGNPSIIFKIHTS